MGILRDLVAGFGGVGKIGYFCKLMTLRNGQTTPRPVYAL